MKYEIWLPIPIAPLYEISNRGVVRNIKSKRVVKPWTPKKRKHDKQVFLRIKRGDRQAKSFHVKGLLWLVHGKISKAHTHARIPVPVILSKGNQVYYLESCRKAAFFLAPLVDAKPRYLVQIFANRKKEFHGWKINYQR